MTIAPSSATGPALGFGTQFTDHMVTARWTPDGWSDPVLRPFEDLSLSPATMVFHYGQAIFEGLKAYAREDGSVALFRPRRNAERFRASARRMAMPEAPDEVFLGAIRRLVEADRSAVPAQPGHSLYLRPFLIATEATLGTRPAREYTLVVIASPSGPYFATGYQAITVWVDEQHPRAHAGGTGAAKCAGNYAAGMVVQREAAVRGADQVVFLDAAESRHLEELGGMNLFLVMRRAGRPVLTTPALTDTILHGITRDSILTLGPDLGLDVEERRISLEEWRLGAADGTVMEAFACGTAAVVTSVGTVLAGSGDFRVADGAPGPHATRLRRELLGIQEGRVDDRHGWMSVVR